MEQKYFHRIQQSWIRCFEKGVSKKLRKPRIGVGEEELKQKKQAGKLLIRNFEEQVKRAEDKFAVKQPLFILTDRDGLLLSLVCSGAASERAQQMGLCEGIYLTEKSCGTNPVALSMETGKFEYLVEEAHYCHFMQSWYSMAVPLKRGKKVLGYLALFLGKKPEEKLFLLFQLTQLRILLAYGEAWSGENPAAELSPEQELVIKYTAQGLTIKQISQKMFVAPATVKYHRNKICQKLQAVNITNAITRAISYGLLDPHEIVFSEDI